MSLLDFKTLGYLSALIVLIFAEVCTCCSVDSWTCNKQAQQRLINGHDNQQILYGQHLHMSDVTTLQSVTTSNNDNGWENIQNSQLAGKHIPDKFCITPHTHNHKLNTKYHQIFTSNKYLFTISTNKINRTRINQQNKSNKLRALNMLGMKIK